MTNVFRPTLSEQELSGIIYELDIRKAQCNTLEPGAELALIKLRTIAYKAKIGAIKPAYQNAGRKNVDLLTALNTVDTKNTPVVAANNYLGVDRRNPNNYTAEQIDEAKFKAADHYINTGKTKDWREFINVLDNAPELERRITDTNTNAMMDDNAIADNLFNKL